jgi:5-formyltetrahydrofolate cyclo-ligase
MSLLFPHDESSPALRSRLRTARRSLSAHEQRRHGAQIAAILGKYPPFLRARRIGAYWATDGELDPGPLLRLAQARHKQCHLPVLRPHPRRKLWFVKHGPGDPWEANRFGIPEPRRRNGQMRPPWALDLLLLPLVGFDADGNRLGMGGGYYDQTLAYLNNRVHWRRPFLVGLAHECQRVERLEARPWDIRLDIVVTEKRIYAGSSPLPTPAKIRQAGFSVSSQ